MSNDVEITVSATDRTGPALKSAKDNTDKLKPSADQASSSFEKLSEEFRRTAQDSDGLGKKLNETGSFSEFLTHKMGALRLEAVHLGQEFNRTGAMDPLAKLKDNKTLQDDIKGLSDDLVRSLGQTGQKAGTEFSKNFSASAQGAESTPGLGPAIWAGVIAAGVTAAPMIGAAIDGALLAGVGLGGLGLGIVGQIKDPEVHNAIASMGTDLEATLTRDTAAFKAPLLGAIDTVKGSLTHLLDGIDFSKLAGDLAPLTAGIAKLFTGMGPGLGKALDAAGPVLNALADELPGLGEALSSFFDSLSAGTEGGADGLRTLIQAIDAIIVDVGNLIEFLSRLYAGFINIGESVTLFFSKILGGIPLLGTLLDKLHTIFSNLQGGSTIGDGMIRSLDGIATAARLSQDDLNSLAGQINEVKVTADTLAASMVNKMFTSMMSVDQSTNAWHMSLTSLGDTLTQNGLAIDRHTKLVADSTKAGEQNRQAIDAVVSANMAQFQANVAAGMSAANAAAQYDTNTAALEKQMRQAGYTQAQIDNLIGKYRAIPDVVNTTIAMDGLKDAINDLDDAIRLANGLDGRVVKLTIQEDHRTSGSNLGNVGHAAGGPGSGLSWVGEMGPELVRLPSGSNVHTAGDSQRMATAGGPATIHIEFGFVGNTDTAFARSFMELVRDGTITILPKAVQ